MDSPSPAPIVHPEISSAPRFSVALVAVVVIVVAAGIATGFLLSRKSVSKSSSPSATAPDMIQTATEFGSTDTKTFSDTATGQLQAGGIKGEGTHHLVRPGGDSQTVYLISSVLDLDQFVGKQVQVYGQTLKGRYAGWLMDVGRVKILQ